MSSAERNLLEDLRKLNASQAGAPAALESTLRTAFRKQHARRRWSYALPPALVAAAAALVFVLLPPDPPGNPRRPAPVAAPAFAFSVPPRPLPPRAAHPVRRRPVQVAAVSKEPPMKTEEFVPLYPGSSLLPLERAQVLRIAIPRSALALAGFSVDPVRLNERVRADVLMGDDGLIRGIRFVR